MDAALYARLVGILSLRDARGRDCTPRGAKTRGLVALLALTPDRRRPRRWIEARLWSDRGPDQASGSLRQALVELRTALGDSAGQVRTDREFVAVEGLRTDIEDDPRTAEAELAAGRELLEGIDVRDQAFEAWLREQRSRLAGRAGRMIAAPAGAAQQRSGVPLLIRAGEVPGGYGGFVALALADAIGGLVSDFALVDVFGPNGATVQLGPDQRGLILSLDAAEADGRLHLLVNLCASRTGQALWSRRAALPLHQQELLTQGEFPGIVFEAAEAAMNALPKVAGSDTAEHQAGGLVARAVREMFTFEDSRLRLADQLLHDAARLAPEPHVFAWHSILAQIMAIERTEADRARLSGEADMFARKAMEGAPNNALVLSLISQVQVMLHGNVEAGTALARDAIQLNPNNAFGYAAKAGALLRGDRPDLALAAAQQGMALASRSGYLQWWEALAGLAHVSLGNFQSAIELFEAAHARAPHFRSPLRHLLFLYLQSGQTAKAVRVLDELKAIEPDFSFELIRDDPDYPAGTLRRVELLRLSMPEE
ncbi:MAG: tetratricopeptide repeat protein [Proteobacteria bacterium]|nr:tetratricopeptide repeat protein [Pseudomonadota bacterium]MBS0572925.1 tetratricopeptide repeat protein [Pseudomonadota bacterium]